MSEAETLAPVADIGGRRQPLLEVRSLSKHFKLGGGLFGRSGVVRAVDDVSFAIDKGEVLASSASPAAENRPRRASSSA
jgi:peptide/nickel transport system ATP-binding protein